MKTFSKEFILWVFIALPYVYLATIWNGLPDQVPTHFNVDGNPDSWTSKTFLPILPGAMGFGIYLLMIVIPMIDPKKRIQQMGNRYYTYRFILTAFFSILTLLLLNYSKEGILKNPNLLITLIGLFFIILGNYLPILKPNYFIGIRTPWTLENEQVWRSTHQFGGRLFMIVGTLIVMLSFFIANHADLMTMFIILVIAQAIILLIYSYTEYKKLSTAASK